MVGPLFVSREGEKTKARKAALSLVATKATKRRLGHDGMEHN